MPKKTLCECGLKEDDSDKNNSSCSLRGLRNHVTFRPDDLIEEGGDESTWSHAGWKAGTLVPKRHWALLGEIVKCQLAGDRYYVYVITRFSSKKLLTVEVHIRPLSGWAHEPQTFSWPNPVFPSPPPSPTPLIVGSTMVVLYPWKSPGFDGEEGLLEPVLEFNSMTVIPCSLASVLDYGDLILRKDLVCHHCKTVRQELLRCSKCKTARYCGKECQKAGWVSHKILCRHSMLVKQLIALPAAPFSEYGFFEMTPEGVWLCLTAKLPVYPSVKAGGGRNHTAKARPWEEDVD